MSDDKKLKPEDHPGWDWTRNRLIPGSEGPLPMEYSVGPDGLVKTPSGKQINPADHPACDWNRNKPSPDLDGHVPVEYAIAPNGDVLKPDGSKINQKIILDGTGREIGRSLDQAPLRRLSTQLDQTETLRLLLERSLSRMIILRGTGTGISQFLP